MTKSVEFRKYNTPSAISSAVPDRCTGVWQISRVTCSGVASPNSITPGAMEFTVILWGPKALARARVMWMTPAFEAP